MAGIYLHIPFCKQACHYCDFHFSTNADIRTELVQAMNEEIMLQKDYLAGEAVATLYFGGGTPSLLPVDEIGSLLETIFRIHNVDSDAEITLEANPDDLTADKLSDLKAIGINRLSIGIQSFDDTVLRYLNRAHAAFTAIRSVDTARAKGFGNVSIDLIYAIPGLSSAQWGKNIETALGLQPEHISAYSLTIEEKTTFGNWLAKGKLTPVDDASAADQMELLVAHTTSRGYRHYEISNFALAGFESRHNSNYWSGGKYLGIGPSAHSFDNVSRQYNVANNYLYLKSLREKKIPFRRDALKREDSINEYILTTLRTDAGCDLGILKSRFGYDVLLLHSPYLLELEKNKLVSLDDRFLKLTEAGKLLADKISSDLFLEG